MAIVNGPITRQSVKIGIGARISGGAQFGPRHDPAQALAPIAVAGGNLPLLWVGDARTDLLSGRVEAWETRNRITTAPGTDPATSPTRFAVSQPTSSLRPIRVEAAPGIVGPGPVTYLQTDVGEQTQLAGVLQAGYFLTSNDTVSPKDTITGMLLVRGADIDGAANVLRVHNSATGEDLRIRTDSPGDAWWLHSFGTGHNHAIGSVANTPVVPGDWQWIRFGYRSDYTHYIRVGNRTEVTQTGTTGYDWGGGGAEPEVTTIELFPGSSGSDDDVQIACAFFCFGDDPTGAGEAAISRWVNHHYPSVVNN